MSRGILGKKLGMTGVFTPEGLYVPVTVIEAGPCVVTQVKTKDTDGYDALQLGFGSKRKDRVNKPLQGHFQKSGDQCFQYLKEFSVKNPADYSPGQELTVEMFKRGDRVDIVGTTNYLKETGYEGWIVMEDECDEAITDPDGLTLRDGIYIDQQIRPLLV